MNAVWQVIVPGSDNRRFSRGLGCILLMRYGILQVNFVIMIIMITTEYTMSGLAPSLSKWDLIGDQLSMSCFLCRYLDFFLRDFVRPCVHNWVIAASIEQCLRYPDQLWVYGKNWTEMTNRWADLLIDFEVHCLFYVIIDYLFKGTNLLHLTGRCALWSLWTSDDAFTWMADPKFGLSHFWS